MSTKKRALLLVSMLALISIQPAVYALGGGLGSRETSQQRADRERREAADKAEREKKEAADKAERERQEAAQRDAERRAAEARAAEEKKAEEDKVAFAAEVKRMSGLAVAEYNKYLTDTYNALPSRWDAWQKAHGEMSINPRSQADLMKEFINDKILKEAKAMTGVGESGALYVPRRQVLYTTWEGFVKDWAETQVKDWNK